MCLVTTVRITQQPMLHGGAIPWECTRVRRTQHSTCICTLHASAHTHACAGMLATRAAHAYAEWPKISSPPCWVKQQQGHTNAYSNCCCCCCCCTCTATRHPLPQSHMADPQYTQVPYAPKCPAAAGHMLVQGRVRTCHEYNAMHRHVHGGQGMQIIVMHVGESEGCSTPCTLILQQPQTPHTAASSVPRVAATSNTTYCSMFNAICCSSLQQLAAIWATAAAAAATVS